ncbi:MAG TPA: carbohydrate ABC transporter permease [Methylomirabilota bacterium]|nr:carbohydrate ABC transporter permease [Methylomirabilota bacterium]
MKPRWRAEPVKTAVLGLFACLSLFYLLGPPAWMLRSSLSPDTELRRVPPTLLPAAPTLRHFLVILQLPGYDEAVLRENIHFKFYRRATANSFVISLGTTLVATSLGAVTAYSISRFLGGRARRWVLLGLLVSRMLPVISVLIPIYLILLRAGLLDTLSGLVLVYSGLLLPFAIWILEAFFRQFPRDLEEAARIDGAPPFAVFARVVVPLSWNALFAAGAFVFISTWSDFIVGFIMTSTERAYPLSVVLARNMSVWREPDWGIMNAAGLFAALIPVALAFLLRGLVVRGRLAGAMKG